MNFLIDCIRIPRIHEIYNIWYQKKYIRISNSKCEIKLYESCKNKVANDIGDIILHILYCIDHGMLCIKFQSRENCMKDIHDISKI